MDNKFNYLFNSHMSTFNYPWIIRRGLSILVGQFIFCGLELNFKQMKRHFYTLSRILVLEDLFNTV